MPSVAIRVVQLLSFYISMSTIVDDHEHVAVFWDYENCTPPTTVPGYDITNNIREIAHKFGSVKQFKAYLELSEQSSSKSLNLRSELQSCGVSLTDCPHNGRKEVADKMMIVDMLTYAIDTPAPATLVLITGDRDFVYAVSVLRLRKYRVVLVAPNTTHTSLRSQASEVLDWDGDVLRKTSKDARHTRVDPSRVRAQSTSVLMCSSPPAQRRPHRPSFRDNSSETVQLTVTRDDGHSRSASMDTGPISHHSIRTTLTRDVDASGSSQQAVADTEHSDIESEDIEHILDLDVYLKKLQNPSSNGESSTVDPSSMLIPSMRCVAACPGPSVVQQIQSDVMQDEKPTDTQVVPLPSTPAVIPSDIPFPSPSRALIEVPLHHLPVQSLPDDKPSETLTSTIASSSGGSMARTTSPDTGFSSSSSQKKISINDANPSIFAEIILAQTNIQPLPSASPICSSVAEDNYSSTPPSTFNGLSGGANTPPTVAEAVTAAVSMQAGSPIRPPVSPIPRAPSVLPVTLPSDRDPVANAPTSANSTNSNSPNLLPIPPHFKSLLQILEKCKRAGVLRPLRSIVGLTLVQGNPKLYSVSGFKNFTMYTAHAEKVGMVTLGGVSGQAWISLNPAWYGRVIVGA